jgi:hypothetical protein
MKILPTIRNTRIVEMRSKADHLNLPLFLSVIQKENTNVILESMFSWYPEIPENIDLKTAYFLVDCIPITYASTEETLRWGAVSATDFITHYLETKENLMHYLIEDELEFISLLARLDFTMNQFFHSVRKDSYEYPIIVSTQENQLLSINKTLQVTSYQKLPRSQVTLPALRPLQVNTLADGIEWFGQHWKYTSFQYPITLAVTSKGTPLYVIENITEQE